MKSEDGRRGGKVRAAVETFEELSGAGGALRGIAVGLLHGGMAEAEQRAAVAAFKSGETQAR